MTKMDDAVAIARLVRDRLEEINEIGKKAAAMGISIAYQAEEMPLTKGPQVRRYEVKAQITIEL
jgi:hypothetical protein